MSGFSLRDNSVLHRLPSNWHYVLKNGLYRSCRSAATPYMAPCTRACGVVALLVGDQLQCQTGENVCARRVRRRDAMRCYATPCQMLRHNAGQPRSVVHARMQPCPLAPPPPPFPIRNSQPARLTASNGCYRRHSTCTWVGCPATSRSHRAGCNRSNGLLPRRRRGLTDRKAPSSPLSSALLVGAEHQDAVMSDRKGLDRDTKPSVHARPGQAVQTPSRQV